MHTEHQIATAADDAALAMRRFEIWPHRSLGRAGIIGLLGAVAVGLALVALCSPARMVWPIGGGCLLTFAVVLIALMSNMRAAETREIVEIDPRDVHVHRISADGRHSVAHFTTHWVRVVVSHDREVASRLTLVESGRRVSVGSFLSPAEREDLARALRAALVDAKGQPLSAPTASAPPQMSGGREPAR
ncbi:MAG: DUF2244 domain-containing protein [Hyphomicrobiaceae bacterium]